MTTEAIYFKAVERHDYLWSLSHYLQYRSPFIPLVNDLIKMPREYEEVKALDESFNTRLERALAQVRHLKLLHRF